MSFYINLCDFTDGNYVGNPGETIIQTMLVIIPPNEPVPAIELLPLTETVNNESMLNNSDLPSQGQIL